MGLFDFLGKKNRKQANQEQKKEPKQQKQEAMMVSNLSSEYPKIYSPAVEHPLLTIQDRISKLEETYRALNEKLGNIDTKVATKTDIIDLKALMKEDIAKGNEILGGIDDLDKKLESLRKLRNELTRQVDASKDDLTRQEEALDVLNHEIDLMECDQKIVDTLSEADLSTIELSEKVGLTRQYIWGRLKELEAGGYVSSVKTGRQTKYHLAKPLPVDA